MPTAADLRRIRPLVAHPRIARTRASTAHHEAAHAVIALVLGLPCHAIRIDGEGRETVGAFAMTPAGDLDDLDAPEIHRPPDADHIAALVSMVAGARGRSPQQSALDLATMTAAGRQAEFLFVGLDWPGALWSEDRDGQDTRAYLLAGDLPTGALGYVQRRARALLTERWDQVQAIAAELLETGRWTADNAQHRA